MTSEQRTVGLDPAWISSALARGAVAPEQVTFEGLVGTGQMSRNARFAVEWPTGDDTTNDSSPSSVVVKLPSDDEMTRSMSFEYGVYQSECGFYDSIAPLVDVAVPQPLAVHLDIEGADFAIVLEDLRWSEQGDHFEGPSDEQLALAIEQAAALHGSAWGSTEGAAYDSVRKDRAVSAQATQDGMAVFLPIVLERLGAGLEPDVITLLEQFADVAGAWHWQQHRPDTVAHGDFRLDNFMFATDSRARPLIVVDWQTAHLGLGTTDFAYLIGGGLEAPRRRDVEDTLMASYVDQLHERGVSYSMDECRSDAAVSALHGVFTGITATAVAARTERGDALFTLMLNRHGRHAIDLDSLSTVAANSTVT